MKTLFAILLLCTAARAETERQIIVRLDLAGKYHAEREVRLPNGDQADLVNATEAIEVDFARHWHESVGQALDYAEQLNKTPGIILLVRPRKKDSRFVDRCKAVCDKHGIILHLETITPIPKGK